MWTQSPSKSAEKVRLIIPVLAESRIFFTKKRGSKLLNDHESRRFLGRLKFSIWWGILDRKDIKVSFKELRETEKKGIKACFCQEHSRSILLINEVA